MNYRLELAVTTGLGDFTLDTEREESRGIELDGGLDGCCATDAIVERFRTRAIGEDGDSDAGPGLVNQFGVGAFEQKRDLERRAQGAEGLPAFLGIGIFHIRFAAIAPCGDGVAATAVAPEH